MTVIQFQWSTHCVSYALELAVDIRVIIVQRPLIRGFIGLILCVCVNEVVCFVFAIQTFFQSNHTCTTVQTVYSVSIHVD